MYFSLHTTGHFFQTVAQANNIVEKTATVGVLTNSSGKLPVRHRQRQIYFCPVVCSACQNDFLVLQAGVFAKARGLGIYEGKCPPGLLSAVAVLQ